MRRAAPCCRFVATWPQYVSQPHHTLSCHTGCQLSYILVFSSTLPSYRRLSYHPVLFGPNIFCLTACFSLPFLAAWLLLPQKSWNRSVSPRLSRARSLAPDCCSDQLCKATAATNHCLDSNSARSTSFLYRTFHIVCAGVWVIRDV